MRVSSSRTRSRDTWRVCAAQRWIAAKVFASIAYAKRAQFVFGKTQFGIADGTDDLSLQVAPSTHKVKNFIRKWIEQQTVDGEVAALNVLARIAAEPHL